MRFRLWLLSLLLVVTALGGVQAPAADAYQNGRIPQSELVVIPSGQGTAYASQPAGAAFNTARFCAVRDGVDLYVVGPVSGYRSYGDQVRFWNMWLNGTGNLAARPGQSNHGYGRAFDLGNPAVQRRWLDARPWFLIRKIEAPSELWHVNFVGGTTFGQPNPGTILATPVLSYGSGGSTKIGACLRTNVLDVQKLLGAERTGFFGKGTRLKVRIVQKRCGLRSDGLVGPATWACVRRSSTGGTGTRRLRVLKPPLTGSDVCATQGLLNSRFRELERKSWSVKRTCAYDNQTAKGVRRFQQVRGIRQSGVVDPATAKALKIPSKTTKTSKVAGEVAGGPKE